MSLRSRHIVALFLLLAVVTSCMEFGQEGGLRYNRRHPLEISSPAAVPVVRGGGAMTVSGLRSSGYNVTCYWTPSGSTFAEGEGVREYFSGVRPQFFAEEAGHDTWIFSPARYWTLDGTLSFFAFAPYFSGKSWPMVFPKDDGSLFPRGEFSVFSEPSDQVDLCLAAPALDRTSSTGVTLNFRHALTKVLFYVNVGGDVYGDGLVYRVKSLSLSGVAGTGTFTTSSGENPVIWDEVTGPRNASYILSLATGTLSTDALPMVEDVESLSGLDRYLCINGLSGGILYLVPQEITASARINVVFASYTSEGGILSERYTFPPVSIPLPVDSPWEPDRVVAYTLTLNAVSFDDVTFGVMVTPWGDNEIEYGLYNLE